MPSMTNYAKKHNNTGIVAQFWDAEGNFIAKRRSLVSITEGWKVVGAVPVEAKLKPLILSDLFAQFVGTEQEPKTGLADVFKVALHPVPKDEADTPDPVDTVGKRNLGNFEIKVDELWDWLKERTDNGKSNYGTATVKDYKIMQEHYALGMDL